MHNSTKKFIRERTKWAKNNPEKAKQHIKDLYDKMFPTTKDYIKFLRTRINVHDMIFRGGTILTRQQHQKEIEYWEEVVKKYNEEEITSDNLVEKDHWKDMTKTNRDLYKEKTEKWLKSKTKKQRTIWNYYMLGVPKKKAAIRLGENFRDIHVTINRLQEDFLKKITPLFNR